MAPAISICLPVYNGERFLAEAIESVLSQTFLDFELLISDDNSIDNSADIIEKYAKKDTRVKYCKNNTTAGLFANYNKCLERVVGRYIKPFAQDDLLKKQCLAKMVAALNDHPRAVLVSCARDWINETGEVIKEVRPFEEDTEMPGEDVINWHLIQVTNWIGEPSTVLFRSTSRGIGFDTAFHHFGDLEYWFRILHSGNYLYLNESLCAFRRHTGSASTSNNREFKFICDLLRLGDLYSQHLERLGETQEHFQRRAVEFIAVYVDHLARNGALAAPELGTGQSEMVQDEGTTIGDSQILNELSSYKKALIYSSKYIVELLKELDHLKRCRQGDHDNFQREIEELQSTVSWKITAPLRITRSLLGRPRQNKTAKRVHYQVKNDQAL
jgi:glycosyltransferase involved in cell wall biosynthesis